MMLRPVVVATILGMTAVTYLTKSSGLWILGRVDVSERLKAGLDGLPAAIVVAILAPELVGASVPELGASLAALVVAWRTENILAAMSAAIVVLLALRSAVG